MHEVVFYTGFFPGSNRALKFLKKSIFDIYYTVINIVKLRIQSPFLNPSEETHMHGGASLLGIKGCALAKLIISLTKRH